ncbi:YbbR-like protein [Desulfomicrobium norvegicum]|uniref:YbbR-like protein n=1 Tax=Desulfomicrobium norvegicum (strain DSM 1741 / NCIMB 8310) TaxID=52561 RepID=A0A8G2C5B2_DESNO|nr:CdaR family protein [Desulfomicrobium norvegicum]SFL99542.1 YbbR-like protein [Desulfomicrobium norvegicum]
MWNNWQYRVLAILLALACWYVVSGQEKVETWLEVPLEFVNLPPRMEITSGLVSKLQVRIRGTSNQVRSLNVGRLAYKLDLGKINVGTNVIPLVPESMTITSAVEVVEISPTRLELVADVVVSKTVPVKLDWTGLPGDDVQFRNATVFPDSVTVTGFASALESVNSISTALVQVPPDESLTASGRARLLMPKDVRTPVSSVSYELQFGLTTQELWVKMNLEPVRYETFSYTFEPKFVRIKLEIPVRLLKDKDWRENLHLMIDPGSNPAIGQSVIAPASRFPEGVSILEAKPEEIEIVVQRNEEFVP